MKNIINLCLFAIVLTIAIVACSKRDVVIATSDNPLEKPSLADQIKPQDSKLIEPKVRAFQELVEASKNGTNTRNITTIAAQELVDNIEMTLNFNHANAARYGAEMIHKRDSFLLQNVNGQVNADNIYDVFKAANNAAYDQYESIDGNNKNLMLVDLSVKSTADGNTWVDVDTYTEKAIGAPNYTFTEGWNFGLLLGKCDYTLAGATDGAEQLQNTLNRRYYSTNLRYFYDRTQEVYINLYDGFGDNPGDNIRGYLIFQRSDALPNFGPCISALDMSWYYSNYHRLITQNPPMDIVTGRPKQFSMCTVFGNSVLGGTYRFWQHDVKAIYGNPYACTNCPEPLPPRKM